MNILKCPVCGGELDVGTEISVGKCKYCESTILIPKDFERKGNLYNRAVFLRQNSEFDKAAEAYEGILKEDNTDVDAHWGLVLSKYGIEYVDDPRTGKKVPTCHRTQPISILSDPDYLAAVENADFEASRLIQREAEEINEIQRKILAIANKEPPYDVFICYKESSELGQRTEDSVIAQDLYYELTKMGYKVFFARKTLEKKLGTEYEPIIYAALSSAQVMVVLGTRPEVFTSVWVKNEWSRFLKMSKDSPKTIIPAYKGMSPYELPVELASLQALDISRIGFLQELCESISRLLASANEATDKHITTQVISEPLPSAERLIRNGETFLSMANYSSAEDAFRKATENYPEEYQGWIGLIKSKTRCFSSVDVLPEKDLPLLRRWISNVKQLAPEPTYAELKHKIRNYCSLVAQSRVPSEINRIKQDIQDKERQIAELSRKIQSAEHAYNSLHEQKKTIEKQKEETYACIRQCEEAAKADDRNTFIGIALIIVAVLLFFPLVRLTAHSSWFLPFIAIGIGFVGFNMAGSNSPSSQGNIKGYNARISDLNKQENIINSQVEESERQLSQTKTVCQEDISIIQQEIENLTSILAKDKKEIAQALLPQVLAEVDLTALEERVEEPVLALPEDSVTFSCPVCGNVIRGNRRALIENGYVICGHCATRIDIGSLKSD